MCEKYLQHISESIIFVLGKAGNIIYYILIIYTKNKLKIAKYFYKK